MDESQVSSTSPPPFLTKTYEMVDDPSTDLIISWTPNYKSFVVWNPPEFAGSLLPTFFKHNNFSSFIRQLNTYGFRKIDPEQWEFANENFIRGQPHLLQNIHRRKPVHSHSMQNLQGQVPAPLTDSERQSYNDDIERLKHDKGILTLEIQRYEQERQVYDMQMQALKDKLQQIEQRQRLVVSTLARHLRRPELALNLVPQLKGHERKRRLPRTSYLYEEENMEDNEIGTCQVVAENMENNFNMLSTAEQVEQLESSLTFWESIVYEVIDSCNQHNSCTSELDESTSCGDSPTLSCAQINADGQPKSPIIDMNCEPTIVVASNPDLPEVQAPGAAPTAAAGANDVFWEQFLTENPGSTESKDIQSGRKDPDNKKMEIKPGDQGKFWWSTANVK